MTFTETICHTETPTFVPSYTTGNGSSSWLRTISSIPFTGATEVGISPSTDTTTAHITTTAVLTSTTATEVDIAEITTAMVGTLLVAPHGTVDTEAMTEAT